MYFVNLYQYLCSSLENHKDIELAWCECPSRLVKLGADVA